MILNIKNTWTIFFFRRAAPLFWEEWLLSDFQHMGKKLPWTQNYQHARYHYFFWNYRDLNNDTKRKYKWKKVR